MRTRFAIALTLAIPLLLFTGCKQKEAPASASQGSVAEAEKEAPAPTSAGSVAEGKELFVENCNACHYADKTDPKLGPGLKGLFKNKQLPISHNPVTDANVRHLILKGFPQGKPMPMPGFADTLKTAQVDSLIRYLKTL